VKRRAGRDLELALAAKESGTDQFANGSIGSVSRPEEIDIAVEHQDQLFHRELGWVFDQEERQDGALGASIFAGWEGGVARVLTREVLLSHQELGLLWGQAAFAPPDQSQLGGEIGDEEVRPDSDGCGRLNRREGDARDRHGELSGHRSQDVLRRDFDPQTRPLDHHDLHKSSFREPRLLLVWASISPSPPVAPQPAPQPGVPSDHLHADPDPTPHIRSPSDPLTPAATSPSSACCPTPQLTMRPHLGRQRAHWAAQSEVAAGGKFAPCSRLPPTIPCSSRLRSIKATPRSPALRFAGSAGLSPSWVGPRQVLGADLEPLRLVDALEEDPFSARRFDGVAIDATIGHMVGNVSIRELRNSTSAVVAKIESGERLTLTVNRRPVADILPYSEGRDPWVPSAELRRIVHEAPTDKGLLADLAEVRGAQLNDD